MPRPRWWYASALNLVLAVLLILGAALFAAALRRPSLEIRDADSGKVYGRWPLAGASEIRGTGVFAIEFVHSVHQSPVRETFSVAGKEIRPLSVRFSAFGAGMQSDLEEGQSMSRDGEALVISGGNRRFRRLDYIVGTVSDHVLFINGEILSLRDLCGKNAHITIRVR